MRDLVDEEKTVTCYYHYYDGIDDPLEGTTSYDDTVNQVYSYPELVEAVKTCTTPNQWFNRIYSLYHRLTGQDLYTPFSFWFDL